MSVRPYKICENNIKNINMINQILFTVMVIIFIIIDRYKLFMFNVIYLHLEHQQIIRL